MVRVQKCPCCLAKRGVQHVGHRGVKSALTADVEHIVEGLADIMIDHPKHAYAFEYLIPATLSIS